jgi:Bacterial alpha-L-rhamnosidase C-terminal domain/Bacterial alpha-L-rhamnosidase 6 hairpin glycosidase domain
VREEISMKASWVACLATAVAMAPAAPASAQQAGQPIPESPAWKQYVLGDGAPDATPARIVSTSGDVENAQGLVHRSNKPTTLTYTAGRPAPTIVLDYGREVGGLPFFDVDGVTPASGASSVSLRAAYSETLQFLWSHGSSTLSIAAAAGDANIKVGSVANFVVGGELKVEDETATIAAVGTQSRSTTLSAPAGVGETNIEVASTTGIAAGDTMRVDVAGTTESVTVTNVDTQGRNLTFTPALTSAHPTGATVLGLGTGITLTAPLQSAHPAGASVTGATPVLTGDRNGFNGVGVAPSRAETFALSAPGRVGNPPDRIQGGQRFQAIMLTTPGTVELTSVGIHFRHPNASSADYAGHFLSSDDELNRIWYQGAYTNDTNMVPIGAVPNQTIPVILDGAKRDRRPWIGDLLVQGRTAFSSLGFGAKGSDYIRSTIGAFGATQAPNGSIFGHIGNWTVWPPAGGFYSTSYSMYFVLDLASYYLYSGDAAFAESQYETMKRQLAYNRTLVDPTSGLLVTGSGNGRDWDFYDGDKPGAVTAYNAIYYKALTDAARLASDLAEHDPGNAAAATWQADAATWSGQAAELKQRINAALFDAGRGVYKLADRDNGTHAATAVPQDANSEAINFGVASADAHEGILRYLRSNLWGKFGPQPYSPDANYSTVISPFVTGMEVDARFAARDTGGALALIHNLWDQMTDKRGPNYTGALWEKLNQDGTDVDANASLAHGWASGPVSSLSGYLLGARPVTPGYKTWIIAPQPGDVEWAQGRIPTPSGAIVSRWRRGHGSSSFMLTMAAPGGTSGTVAIPQLGRSRTIVMDCKVVWRDGAPERGVTAVERDGAVQFSAVEGSHTFAWGARPC